MILRYTAGERDDGRKLYYVLRDELQISATLLRRMKRLQAISVNGEPAFTDRRLRPGETVTADVSAAEPPCGLIPEAGELSVLREDEGMLAVNKSPGILTHPTHARNTGTLLNAAAGYLAARGEPPVCHAVNRLDRDTSGVTVLAKNSYMKAFLAAELAEGGKEYLALVLLGPPTDEGVADMPIGREEPPGMRRFVTGSGQRAVTRWRVLARREGAALVSLALETGRTHQIRVHMAALGCPVLGDRLYATADSAALSERMGIARQALHARSLRYYDRLTGRETTLTAPVTRPEFDAFRAELEGGNL